MKNYMHEITPKMVATVDKLLQTDFENATLEEIETYTEWTRINALQDEEFRLNAEEREKTAKAERENNKQLADAAIQALNSLNELAQARLKAVQNGEI